MSAMLQRIRLETGWDDVREERRKVRWLMQTYHDRKIDLVPTNPDWPEIYFVFSDDYANLMQFGMGEWHGHPETEEAIGLAADFVAARTCVLERWTRSGTYAGSGMTPLEPGAPDWPNDDGFVLRRVVFNRAPQDVQT